MSAMDSNVTPMFSVWPVLARAARMLARRLALGAAVIASLFCLAFTVNYVRNATIGQRFMMAHFDEQVTMMRLDGSLAYLGSRRAPLFSCDRGFAAGSVSVPEAYVRAAGPFCAKVEQARLKAMADAEKAATELRTLSDIFK